MAQTTKFFNRDQAPMAVPACFWATASAIRYQLSDIWTQGRGELNWVD
jgi:hypothetical protein